jgi:hypothetical protein
VYNQRVAAPSAFRFRSLDNIGVADAENDAEFLKDCFVDTGQLAALCDCAEPRCVVVGRTGAGKTALLQALKEKVGDRAIEVKPEELALAHISNSTILRYISDELGVNLDPFFKLLWRHVFVVELIKRRFRVESEADRAGLLSKLGRFFSGPSDKEQKWKRALAYLEKHGPSFWLETDVRIREVTERLERTLKGSIGTPEGTAEIPLPTASISGERRVASETKSEHVTRAQRIVNDIQIRELSDVLDLLDGVLDDPQKPYYLVVDRLDENWVEDRVRYQLIRALLETARDFYKIRHAKLIIAVRKDLIERVFRVTRGPGFQEEKYQSQFLALSWTKANLIGILDERINHLVRRQYTTATVTHADVLPPSIDGEGVPDYLIRRTLMRPRDVIVFFNACIALADGSPVISSVQVKDAEGSYSRARLRSLADEWYADYPNLLRFAEILKKQPRRFRLGALTDAECESFCNQLLQEALSPDPLQQLVWDMSSNPDGHKRFRQEIAHCFYLTGLVGLKLESFEKTSWAGNERSVSRAEIGDGTKVEVHPCFWRALGTSLERRKT